MLTFEDGDPSLGKILLIAEVLVGGDEEIEFRFSHAQKLAVAETSPAPVARRHAFMTDEQMAEWPRHALVQQDSHETEAMITDSERSRSSQAIPRLTEGKYSTNSASV